MAKIVFLILFTTITSLAQAGETWVNFGGRSYHVDRSKGRNEWNWGFGITQPVNSYISQSLGYYRNSNYEDSFYMVWPTTIKVLKNVRIGLSPGVVIGGYKEAFLPIAPPIGILTITKDYAVSVVYIPRILANDEVWWFRLEVRVP